MYITDTETGETRLYGTNCHDSLVKSDDGRTLTYYNLQCGEGSRFGTYVFTDEKGRIPKDNENLLKHGTEDYFNIGGFGDIHGEAVIAEIEDLQMPIMRENDDYHKGVFEGLAKAREIILNMLN